MKQLLTVLVFVMALTASAQKPQDLAIGAMAPMPDYTLVNMDEANTNLASLKGDNGLLVIFSCNTCPFVLAWEEEYPKLYAKAQKEGVGFVLVNSNEAKRKGDDSMMAMVSHAKEKGYDNVPYVIDQDSKLANAFGARTTPHVYLFDKNMKLVFKGAIDDRFENKEKKVTKTYLSNAMDQMRSGKEISPAVTKNIGCSIKRI